MNRKTWMWGAAALAAALLALLTAGITAAQGVSRLSGQVLDRDGKPLADATIILKNEEQGQTLETKTDKSGRWMFNGLRTGIYTVSVKTRVVDPKAAKDPKTGNPIGEDRVVYETRTRVTASGEDTVNVNFKELIEKQGAANVEARKKQEEESKKFEGLKAHFDAGRQALDQAKPMKAEIERAPADQKAALQEKQAGLLQTAISEFQAAQASADAKDTNLPVVMVNLAEALDAAKKYDEAAAAYQKAIELRPNEAAYYNNLGNELARAGKVTEAGAAFQKSSDLDPANATMAWRNFGIILYSSNKAKDAVEPLRKATALDPKSAQAWYVLGASLVNAMGFKQEGDKIIPILQPGTIEAYQKCIELDPNGPYGAQAKAGLEQLEAMGLGISTKTKTAKKK